MGNNIAWTNKRVSQCTWNKVSFCVSPKTHIPGQGIVYGRYTYVSKPCIAARKPDPPRIIETSILGKTQNEQSKFSDLRFCKK